VKVALLPPFLSADYCIRCCRNYLHKEPTVIVLGGPGARHRDLGITICLACLVEKGGVDNPVAEGVYDLHKRGVEGIGWPGYYNATRKRIWGYLHVAKLQGPTREIYRVGLEAGFPSIWTRKHVESVFNIIFPGMMGWSEHFDRYDRVVTDPNVFINVERDIRFYDLSTPGKFYAPPLSVDDGKEPS
jgi:hypothetical protein